MEQLNETERDMCSSGSSDEIDPETNYPTQRHTPDKTKQVFTKTDVAHDGQVSPDKAVS